MKSGTLIRTAFGAAGIVGLAFAAWALLYPAPDYRNPEFVLWKFGLYPSGLTDLDTIASSLHNNPDTRSLVVGRTEAQLTETFGYLTPLDKAPGWMHECIEGAPWAHRRIETIRHSIIGVVFEKGRSVDYIQFKRC